MAGLIFLAIVLGLCVGAFWLAIKATSKLPKGWVRNATVILIVSLLLTLIVVDEVIGGYQFKALCEQNAVLKINAEKIKGKTIRVSGEPVNEVLEGTAVKIYYSRIVYRDMETNEELASESRYTAKGGWFIRTIGFSDSTPPLTFPSTCSPPDQGDPAVVYGFKFAHSPKKEK